MRWEKYLKKLEQVKGLSPHDLILIGVIKLVSNELEDALYESDNIDSMKEKYGDDWKNNTEYKKLLFEVVDTEINLGIFQCNRMTIETIIDKFTETLIENI